jgi:hypothetical protein
MDISSNVFVALSRPIQETDATNYWNQLLAACVAANVTGIIQDMTRYIQGADEKYVYGNLQPGARAAYTLFVNNDEKLSSFILSLNNPGTITSAQELAIENAFPVNRPNLEFDLYVANGAATVDGFYTITLNSVGDKIASQKTYNFASDYIYFTSILPQVSGTDIISLGFDNTTSFYGRLNATTLSFGFAGNTDLSSVPYIAGQTFTIYSDTVTVVYFLDNSNIYQQQIPASVPPATLQFTFVSGTAPSSGYTFDNINVSVNKEVIPLSDSIEYVEPVLTLINSNYAVSTTTVRGFTGF